MLIRALLAAIALLAIATGAVLAQMPAGPPYPEPQFDVVVYDYANVLSAATESQATATIVAIEKRVGAEVVVYTQIKPSADEVSTERDAKALLDQWLIGRAGFFDGLVIFINMNRVPCIPGASGNGQVQLYAGDGYKGAYLSDGERQKIFDDEMVPHLRVCDIDEAVLVALEKIDANATFDHRQTLETARRIDAAVGLVGGPLAFLLLVGAASWSWLRYGKDPVYLDDASIHMPAPPPDLTAASGAVVWEGRATRRALTTAMLDLASRGELRFVPESGLLSKKAGIQITNPDG
ncbi:MAG TPA: TPM domain-containing protein, partial [Candidatus Limnocylindrales bacterium]|nr:TPM domain-containing protein [Candidatus Limnocylindrales bacterium]